MTSLRCHNRYFSSPCNFAIFEGRSSAFGNLGHFDMFMEGSIFHNETVFDTNGVRMTSLEGTQSR